MSLEEKEEMYIDNERMIFVYLKKSQIYTKENEECDFFVNSNSEEQVVPNTKLTNGNTDENGNFLPDAALRDEIIKEGYTEIHPMD